MTLWFRLIAHLLVTLARLACVWRITDFARIGNSPHTGYRWAFETTNEFVWIKF